MSNKKENSFPCYMYSKEGAKIFKTEEELKEAGNSWVDSPTKVEENKPSEKSLTVDELKKKLLEECGAEESDLQGLKKPELIELYESLKDE